jgi:hypothetical protein
LMGCSSPAITRGSESKRYRLLAVIDRRDEAHQPRNLQDPANGLRCRDLQHKTPVAPVVARINSWTIVESMKSTFVRSTTTDRLPRTPNQCSPEPRRQSSCRARPAALPQLHRGHRSRPQSQNLGRPCPPLLPPGQCRPGGRQSRRARGRTIKSTPDAGGSVGLRRCRRAGAEIISTDRR